MLVLGYYMLYYMLMDGGGSGHSELKSGAVSAG